MPYKIVLFPREIPHSDKAPLPRLPWALTDPNPGYPCLGHPTVPTSVPPSSCPLPYLVVHLLGAVEHVDHDTHGPAQVLGGLCFPGARRASGGSPHVEVEGLCQGDVAPAEGDTGAERGPWRGVAAVPGAGGAPTCQSGG